MKKMLVNSTPRNHKSSSRNKYAINRPMTFKEMRERERINETAHIAPGSTHVEKTFASDLKNVDFGSKYKFVPKEGPPPGLYNPDTADKHVKPRIIDVLIEGRTDKLGDFMEGSKKMESANDPGKYDGHLTKFADGL